MLSLALSGDPDGGVRWKPDAWRRWIQVDCVPPDLVAQCLIRKRDLYKLASQVADEGDDQAVAALVIAVQAWGSGVAGQGGDGRGPSRASAALGLPRLSPDATLDPVRLDAVRHAVALSRTDVADAWKTLKRGPGHLPRWDEPFFTKLMHAAGYGHSPRPWPLILDGRVRGALRAIGHPPHGHGRADYLAYLQLADQWAEGWDTTPAQVELALFTHAGRT